MATNYYYDSGTTSSTWTTWTTHASTTYTPTTVWYNWTSTGPQYSVTLASDTTTTAASSVWKVWTTYPYPSGSQYTEYQPAPETEEQKQARLEREQRWSLEQGERLRKEQEKSARALALLMLLLDEQQKKQFKEKQYFELRSVHSGNRYRIRKGYSLNVDLLNKDGSVKKQLCFHPDGYHDYDVMASQKLMLEHDEERVAKIINMPELMRAVGQN